MCGDCTTQEKQNELLSNVSFCVAKPKVLALTKSTEFMATHTQQTQIHTFRYIEHCWSKCSDRSSGPGGREGCVTYK